MITCNPIFTSLSVVLEWSHHLYHHPIETHSYEKSLRTSASIVEAAKRNTKKSETKLISFNINQLLRDVTPKRRSRRQLAQLDQRKPYITACFRQLPQSFMVGSDHRHNICENKPLEPGHEYVFFLLAELNATTGVSY